MVQLKVTVAVVVEELFYRLRLSCFSVDLYIYIWIGDVVSIGAHAKSKKNCSSATSEAIRPKFGSGYFTVTFYSALD